MRQELTICKEPNPQSSARLKAHITSKESESRKLTETKFQNATRQSKKLQEITMSFRRDMNMKLKT